MIALNAGRCLFSLRVDLHPGTHLLDINPVQGLDLLGCGGRFRFVVSITLTKESRFIALKQLTRSSAVLLF